MTPRALSAAILTTLVAVVPLTHQAFIPAARVIDGTAARIGDI